MQLRRLAVALAATAAFVAPSAWAQEGVPATDAAKATTGSSAADGDDAPTPEESGPPPEVSIEDRGELRIDLALITVPDINFTETPAYAANFDKYFFFHREGTTFEEALKDIRECDDFARGISYHTAQTSPYSYGYGMAGALGAALGDAIADAIFGSAARRRLRWQNLRICMRYKEYQRYGLPKEAWEAFNFSEGNATVSERKRQGFLQQQAKIASGPKPTGRVLEP